MASELPELHDMFLRYKQLKKTIKHMPQQHLDSAAGEAAGEAHLVAAATLSRDIEVGERWPR